MIFDDFRHSLVNKFTFAGRDDEFLIYVFCSSDDFDFGIETDRLNSIAKKYSVPEFWGKRSVHNEEFPDYKNIYVFRGCLIENVKFT